MKNSCEKFKDQLIDVYYSEEILDSNLKHHLETCEKCSKFYEELNTIEQNFKILETDTVIDYYLISEAFDKADEIQSNRKSIMEIMLFILISTSIIIFIGYIASLGYGMMILKLQFSIFFLVPLILPIMIKHRLTKEGYNGRT